MLSTCWPRVSLESSVIPNKLSKLWQGMDTPDAFKPCELRSEVLLVNIQKVILLRSSVKWLMYQFITLESSSEILGIIVSGLWLVVYIIVSFAWANDKECSSKKSFTIILKRMGPSMEPFDVERTRGVFYSHDLAAVWRIRSNKFMALITKIKIGEFCQNLSKIFCIQLFEINYDNWSLFIMTTKSEYEATEPNNKKLTAKKFRSPDQSRN